MSIKVALITNGSATGSAQQWRGGPGVFAVVATWAGATVKLQHLGPDDTTWLDISGGDVTLTADGNGGFVLPQGSIRAAVTGGPPSGVYAKAYSVS